MKSPVALFRKKSMKLYLFSKAKSQGKAYHHSCMLFALEKRRKEKCYIKIDQSFLELIRFVLYLRFKINTSLREVFFKWLFVQIKQNL